MQRFGLYFLFVSISIVCWHYIYMHVAPDNIDTPATIEVERNTTLATPRFNIIRGTILEVSDDRMGLEILVNNVDDREKFHRVRVLLTEDTDIRTVEAYFTDTVMTSRQSAEQIVDPLTPGRGTTLSYTLDEEGQFIAQAINSWNRAPRFSI